MGAERITEPDIEHQLADLDFKAWQVLEEHAAAQHCEGFNPVRNVTVDLGWIRTLVDRRKYLLRKLDQA